MTLGACACRSLPPVSSSTISRPTWSRAFALRALDILGSRCLLDLRAGALGARRARGVGRGRLQRRRLEPDRGAPARGARNGRPRARLDFDDTHAVSIPTRPRDPADRAGARVRPAAQRSGVVTAAVAGYERMPGSAWRRGGKSTRAAGMRRRCAARFGATVPRSPRRGSIRDRLTRARHRGASPRESSSTSRTGSWVKRVHPGWGPLIPVVVAAGSRPWRIHRARQRSSRAGSASIARPGRGPIRSAVRHARQRCGDAPRGIPSRTRGCHYNHAYARLRARPSSQITVIVPSRSRGSSAGCPP